MPFEIVRNDMTKMMVFDHDSFKLSEALFWSISSYIDAHYVELHQDVFLCDTVVEYCETCAPMVATKTMSLEEILDQADAGFTETLFNLIDKTGKKDSEIYKKANISKQHFSKIRNNPNYKPRKPTAIALALALELSLEDTKDLIGRAGYALTNSSKFDLIIRYFIEQGNYDVVQINMALYEFDQHLLGA